MGQRRSGGITSCVENFPCQGHSNIINKAKGIFLFF